MIIGAVLIFFFNLTHQTRLALISFFVFFFISYLFFLYIFKITSKLNLNQIMLYGLTNFSLSILISGGIISFITFFLAFAYY
jgi:hypothetical protein